MDRVTLQKLMPDTVHCPHYRQLQALCLFNALIGRKPRFLQQASLNAPLEFGCAHYLMFAAFFFLMGRVIRLLV